MSNESNEKRYLNEVLNGSRLDKNLPNLLKNKILKLSSENVKRISSKSQELILKKKVTEAPLRLVILMLFVQRFAFEVSQTRLLSTILF